MLFLDQMDLPQLSESTKKQAENIFGRMSRFEQVGHIAVLGKSSDPRKRAIAAHLMSIERVFPPAKCLPIWCGL